MKCLKRYKQRASAKGLTTRDRVIHESTMQFNRHVLNSPNSYEVQVTDVGETFISKDTKIEKCFVTNMTLNDQNVLDEKYIHFALDTNVDVGCYVLWQGIHWVLIFREHNTIDSHLTFTMRRCNQVYRFKDNEDIYNIPISVTNLTLYSDGMIKNVYLTQQDAKRKIVMGKNPITSRIEVGDRIMLTNLTVFIVTHIDDFSQTGVLSMLVRQTTLISEDDKDNNIAHNNSDILPNWEGQIICSEDVAYLGDEVEVFINKDINIEEYELESEWKINSNNDSAIIERYSNTNCIIKITTDSRHIGEEIEIRLFDLNSYELIDTKTIKIKGFF